MLQCPECGQPWDLNHQCPGRQPPDPFIAMLEDAAREWLPPAEAAALIATFGNPAAGERWLRDHGLPVPARPAPS